MRKQRLIQVRHYVHTDLRNQVCDLMQSRLGSQLRVWLRIGSPTSIRVCVQLQNSVRRALVNRSKSVELLPRKQKP